MAKKRKSSGAKPSTTQQAQPASPTTPTNPVPEASTRATAGSGSNIYNTAVAAILAGIQIFSDGDRWTRIPIILGILFVLFALWIFTSWIIFPILSLLKYPLSPVTWVLTKIYHVLYWIYSWIAWFVVGVAWLGFYIHFFKTFVGYVIDGLNTFFTAMDKGYADFKKEQEEGSSGSPRAGEPQDDDDDEIPELVDP
jgi:hypothetical protein